MTPQRFHNLLIVYLYEYRVHLLQVKSIASATSHCSIVHEFIDYLYNQHLVGGIEQITVSMCCSKWMAHYRKRNKDVVSKDMMKGVLKGYSCFWMGSM